MLINLSSFLLKTIQNIPRKEIKYHSMCLDCTWYLYQYLLPCLLYSVWVTMVGTPATKESSYHFALSLQNILPMATPLNLFRLCSNPSLPYWFLLTVYLKGSFSLHLHHDLISWCLCFFTLGSTSYVFVTLLTINYCEYFLMVGIFSPCSPHYPQTEQSMEYKRSSINIY